MVTTDTFTQFGRRMATTQGCPFVVIAETPNPVRGLDPEDLRARAEAMLPAIIDGLTLPPAEIERRIRAAATGRQRPVRSAVPI
ncbi:MAG: hypothetical protein EXR29_05220 [Betaproteobacteria bacterium]|nr:hypothetical protein [Betaproteobacteria bacterium]